MSTVKRFSRTPLGAAIVGGLIVAILGLDRDRHRPREVREQRQRVDHPRLGAVVSPPPKARQRQGPDREPDLPVGRPRCRLHPGPVRSRRPPSPLNPFGGSGGGTATGSGFVIDNDGPHPHQRPRRRRREQDRGHARRLRQRTAREREGRRQGPLAPTSRCSRSTRRPTASPAAARRLVAGPGRRPGRRDRQPVRARPHRHRRDRLARSSARSSRPTASRSTT